MLAERGRLVLSVPLLEWFEAAAHPRSVELVPVTPAIAAEVAALPATFHRDPVDRLIVATCRVLGAQLVTHDLLITRSRLVARWRPGRIGLAQAPMSRRNRASRTTCVEPCVTVRRNWKSPLPNPPAGI